MQPAPSDIPRLATAATWGRLQTFLTVVDGGSVTAAAETLHVTPPAVSAAVAALERELGTALFTKAGRGIRPTRAGTTFADYTRRMIGLLEEARAAVREADRGLLRLGAVATASEFVLAPLLASFTAHHPDVELSLTVLPRDDLFDALGHHELDVVLAGRPPRGSGLVTRAQRANHLVVVGAPQVAARLPGGPGRGPSSATWLLRGRGSGTRGVTLALLERLDSRPRTLDLGTLGAVLAAAREGLGITLVHADAVAADLGSGRLVTIPVTGTPISRPWHLVAASEPTAAVRLFVSHVCDADLFAAAAFRPGRR